MCDCLVMEGNFGYPASRSHVFGWKAEEAVENARRQVAELVNADISDGMRLMESRELRYGGKNPLFQPLRAEDPSDPDSPQYRKQCCLRYDLADHAIDQLVGVGEREQLLDGGFGRLGVGRKGGRADEGEREKKTFHFLVCAWRV